MKIQIINSINQNNKYKITENKLGFRGYVPDKNNLSDIKKIAKFIKDKGIKKIAIIGHEAPDGDAIGSMLALKRMIERGTKKYATIFVSNPVPKSINFLTKKKEINVISKMIPEYKTKPEELAEKIKNIYGQFDLVIAVDTSNTRLFNSEIKQGIFDNAKNIIKIDHHPPLKTKNYNYGLINLIDTTKESAAQVVMQLARNLGLKKSTITKEISDPIALGAITDSIMFRETKTPAFFKDIADLAKTTDISQITKRTNEVSQEGFDAYQNMFKDIIITKDKKCAYFLVDENKTPQATKVLRQKAMTALSDIKGIEYYFSIAQRNEKGIVKSSASVRSNSKPIREAMNKLNGGGHELACGLKVEGKTADELAKSILEVLNIQA